MFSGFIVGLVAYISSTLALLISPIAYIPLKFVIFIVEFLGSLPFAEIILPPIPFYLFILVYAVFGYLI